MEASMTRYRMEFGGFTRWSDDVAGIQAAIDDLKVRYSMRGEIVRIYRVVNGIAKIAKEGRAS